MTEREVDRIVHQVQRESRAGWPNGRPMSLCNCRFKGGYASDTLHFRGEPGCAAIREPDERRGL